MIKSLETSMLNIGHDIRTLAPFCAKYGIEAIGTPQIVFDDEKAAAEIARKKHLSAPAKVASPFLKNKKRTSGTVRKRRRRRFCFAVKLCRPGVIPRTAPPRSTARSVRRWER